MASNNTRAGVPVNYLFAALVLLALIGLGALRHLSGTISIS